MKKKGGFVDYNYHTHTARCHHARGTAKEYLECALQGGLKWFGFSDHAPFIFPDGSQTGYRVAMEEAADYMAELQDLRRQYQARMEIHIGFELEYYPRSFPAMLKVVRDLGAEYLILGQHYLSEENAGGFYSMTPTAEEGMLSRYVDLVVEGMKTGVFSYVAHPDLFNFIGEKEVYRRHIRRLCAASVELDIPLEINFLGIRQQRIYPNEAFWKIVGEEGCPVTFGLDSHAPEDAAPGAALARARQLVERYHLNYIGRAKLVLI